ncbi:MAG: carbohydrate ABC transporter permease [Anaerolineales bacterium]|nr:carbohydrate ABC transporter permease [Anaerolineales bacterium]MBS3753662.1 carbohydrate ABC transporter permease [Anaerolineales bacterium]
MAKVKLFRASKTDSAATFFDRFRDVIQKLITYLFLLLGVVIAITPFVWMISTSLMSLGESLSIRWFPSSLHFENYLNAWREAQFSEYFINSVIITSITLIGQVTFSVLAAYAFARIDFPGRDLIFTVMLSTMMIPAMVIIIPNFLTVTWLGRIGPIKWINNWPALTIPFMGNVFSIFLLKQFFAQIPDELWDSARIDGAGHLRFLWTVVLPLSTAPLMVIVVLSFIGSWNALAWPLLVTNSPEWRPIAVGLNNFVDEAGQELNLMMAGAFITIIPILIIYFFTQKQFTESIARSGLKG